MESLYVILRGHEVVPADGPTWATWVASVGIEGRRVALDRLPDGRTLSTVFLHGVRLAGPRLFETMLFDPEDAGLEGEPPATPRDVGHYATWDAAATGHQAILRRLRDGLPAEEASCPIP
jgi:hypothetical protein